MTWYVFLALITLWILLNIISLVKSFSYNSIQSVSVMFPFNYRSDPGLWAYDFSEFIVYSCFIPYLLCLYFKKCLLRIRKKVFVTILSFLAYCNFVLLFMLFSDNYDMALLLVSIIGGALIFLFAMHIAEILFSIFKL